MVAIFPLPEVHDLVEGVVSVRGKTVPVINLARRLDLRPPPYGLETMLVIVTFGDKWMAVPVDAVVGVRDIPDSSLHLPDNIGPHSDLLTGVAELGEERLRVLDPAALFTDDILFRYPEWEEILEPGDSDASGNGAAAVGPAPARAPATENPEG